MSEAQTSNTETPRITRSEKTNKPKDPRRVEAGKRLAAISKSAKEKKARERFEKERETDNTRTESPSNWVLPASTLVVVGLGGLCYTYMRKKTAKETTPSEDPKQQAGDTMPRPVSKLDSFD